METEVSRIHSFKMKMKQNKIDYQDFCNIYK